MSAAFKDQERRVLHSDIPAQVAVSRSADGNYRLFVVYTDDVFLDFGADEEAARNAALLHNVINGHIRVEDRRVGR